MTKPNTQLNDGQLPLLSDLMAQEQPVADGAVPPKKFMAPDTVAHAVALWLLLNGPQPLPQLQRLAANDGKLLHALRALGLELPCYSISMLDAVGRTVECQVCALTDRDAKRVKRWIKRHGGANA